MFERNRIYFIILLRDLRVPFSEAAYLSFYQMVTIAMLSGNLTFSAPAIFKYIFILIFCNIMKTKLPALDSSVMNSMSVSLLSVSLRCIQGVSGGMCETSGECSLC